MAVGLALGLAVLPAAAQTPPTRVLGEQALVDIAVGAAILCTRGADTASLIGRLRAASREGLVFRLIALEDVPDGWLGFTSFTVGGAGAWPHVTDRMARETIVETPPEPGVVLGRHLDKTFATTFQAEAGGATVAALITGARMGVPTIDACPSGRCLPEVQMSPFMLSGIGRAPLAAVTSYGDVVVIDKSRDDYRAEDLLRGLAVASGGRVKVAANALDGRVLKKHLIPGFVSRSERLGRAAREAVEAGTDPVEAVRKAGDGYLLFRGVVTRSDSRGERGFGVTEAEFRGVGVFAGSRYRIFNKNENLVAWRDGKLDAAAPDLISALDPRTGWAIRGGTIIGSFVVGEEVSIVGFASHPIWRAPAAVELLSPRRWGFAEDWTPIEQLHDAAPQSERTTTTAERHTRWPK